MIWEEWVNSTSQAIGNIGIEVTANLLSLTLIAIIMICMAIATRGSLIPTLIGSLLPMFFFVTIGWLSYWVLLVIVLVVAGMYASKIGGIFGGDSGGGED